MAPGATAYDHWIQVQTYDVTNQLNHIGKHELLVSVGDGWYKGRYGLNNGGRINIYGDQQRILAELYIEFTDGTTELIKTDKSWLTTAGNITLGSIYDGEDIDDTIRPKSWLPVDVLPNQKRVLQDRLSLPIRVKESLNVKEVIKTPAGETVLDFGQNQVGWLSFYNRMPKGEQVVFQFGEVLQQGNFYRENLKTARAAFTYISDGEEKWVRPHFTYFGYRYVKIEGLAQSLRSEDFRAEVMYSDMKQIGEIKTDHPKVNRLFENILWGQKSNFFDVPTDCPQRDERLGWTGDANIFSKTAAFNMDVFAFFKKYAKDMQVEQRCHEGMLPNYAPAMGDSDGGSAAWGDAAVMIPWNMYQMYGDPAILKQNYESMKSWVNWITKSTTVENLWTGTFQFGDWLALDGEDPSLYTGKTDKDFIASAFYFKSSEIVADTAALLGYSEDEIYYRNLSERIKVSFQNEFITKTGRVAIDTQTAYVIILHFGLVNKKYQERVIKAFLNRLKTDDYALKTGFVGTPYICQVLSSYGYHNLAIKIFMRESFPSWLYAVNMGATTIWERWNSIQEDGTMHPSGMNSLNHYSLGAVKEWAYQYVLGIHSRGSGFKEIEFAPNFDYRLKKVEGGYETPYGQLKIVYAIETDECHTVRLKLKIPFGVTLHLNLPRSESVEVRVNDKVYEGPKFSIKAGSYDIYYIPSRDFVERYHSETTVAEIMADQDLVNQINQIDGVLNFFKEKPEMVKSGLGKMSLSKLNATLPFIHISSEKLKNIHDILRKTTILNERRDDFM